MRKLTRVKNLIIAFIMIVFAIILLEAPEFGPVLIILIAGFGLIASGIGTLIFYITMASHMVGGKKTFYSSIITMSLGVFMLAGYAGATDLVLLYLMGLFAISGGIGLIRALESKKEGALWIHRLIGAIFNFAVFIIGFLFTDNPHTMVYLFCIDLIYSAVSRIISSFRKTAIIYIPQ